MFSVFIILALLPFVAISKFYVGHDSLNDFSTRSGFAVKKTLLAGKKKAVTEVADMDHQFC
jgi:hypothetical protein